MSDRYTEGIGRRKSSVARVRITPSDKQTVLVNDKKFEEYFPVSEYRTVILEPLSADGVDGIFSVSVHVSGGGLSGQADSIRLGIARALNKLNPELRGQLKKEGYLKRDARVKERKKPGLRKARKSPQWSKR